MGSAAESARKGSGAKAVKVAPPPKAAGRGARLSASARASTSATAEFDVLLRRIYSDIDEADRLLAEATPAGADAERGRTSLLVRLSQEVC